MSGQRRTQGARQVPNRVLPHPPGDRRGERRQARPRPPAPGGGPTWPKLLNQVTSSLPSVGYTVAIEWAYYAFILMSVVCVLVALVGGRLHDRRKLTALATMDTTARIAYPLTALTIASIYLIRF
jgi:hypothetical protein